MPLAERINDTILHSYQMLIQRFDNQAYDFQLPALLPCQKLPFPHHYMALLAHREMSHLNFTLPTDSLGGWRGDTALSQALRSTAKERKNEDIDS